MGIHSLIQIGHPSLKATNKSIHNFKSLRLRKLIQDLKDTIIFENLIGIAAPQINKNYLVFITYPRNTKARKLEKTDKLRIYINPVLTYVSSETSLIYEGCGCVLQKSEFGPVIRPKEIEITAYNEKGRKFTLVCDGILARVIQHEIDHMNGIEFIDRIKDKRTLVGREYYLSNIRNSKSAKEASRITKIDYKLL